MSSHLYNKQPGCVWTHTSCLPSHDRESTQGFFFKEQPLPCSLALLSRATQGHYHSKSLIGPLHHFILGRDCYH